MEKNYQTPRKETIRREEGASHLTTEEIIALTRVYERAQQRKEEDKRTRGEK